MGDVLNSASLLVEDSNGSIIPTTRGDDCTALFLSDELIQSLCGGERDLPHGPIPITPTLDLRRER